MQEPFCESSKFPKSCLTRLQSLVKKNNGSVDKKLLEKAFYLAKEAHKGQYRASKKPYFSHPLETAAILAKMGLGSNVVAAGLLHDVLEDTPIKKPVLCNEFGNEVCSLVEGVTKLDILTSESRNNESLKNLHNLLFATTKDPRVILIKLADKMHNLKTLKYLPKKSRERIAEETLTIYVPIARKIGMEAFAVELEDLAFCHAKPEIFERLNSRLKPLRTKKEKEINLMIAILRKKLPKASFYKRQKSAYGVFTKMKNTGKALEEINDIVILKILFDKKPDCYSALGIIHGTFPPLPNKVKDFIGAPKPTFYSVLQTTVFGPKKRPVKIRIATHKMNAINRNGVIAYKKLSGKKMSEYLKQNLSKLGSLLANGGDETDFITALKGDFLTRPIYVFTATGTLLELPNKSTVLDFAFAAEKNWALHLLRAKVNGKNAKFSKRLRSGNIIELFFSQKPRAKKSWLKDATNFISKEALRKYFKLNK